MILTVKSFRQKTVRIDVDPSETVLTLKLLIEREFGEGYPVNDQELIYAGTILNDNKKTISSYNINEKKIIVVMINKNNNNKKKTNIDEIDDVGNKKMEITPPTPVMAPNSDLHKSINNDNKSPTTSSPSTSTSSSSTSSPSNDSTDQLSFLLNHPQCLQMRSILRENPELLSVTLEQIRNTNPELLKIITANSDYFMNNLLDDTINTDTEMNVNAGGIMHAEDGDDRIDDNHHHHHNNGIDEEFEAINAFSKSLSLTKQETDAIERLKELGFPEHFVLQAYFACDKDENLTANFLVSQILDE